MPSYHTVRRDIYLPVARMCSRWGLLWILHTPIECLQERRRDVVTVLCQNGQYKLNSENANITTLNTFYWWKWDWKDRLWDPSLWVYSHHHLAGSHTHRFKHHIPSCFGLSSCRRFTWDKTSLMSLCSSGRSSSSSRKHSTAQTTAGPGCERWFESDNMSVKMLFLLWAPEVEKMWAIVMLKSVTRVNQLRVPVWESWDPSLKVVGLPLRQSRQSAFSQREHTDAACGVAAHHPHITTADTSRAHLKWGVVKSWH